MSAMPGVTLIQEPNDYRIVVFGSAKVGKTSLIIRFLKNTFKEHYNPTIEDTYQEAITYNDAVYSLHITDTGGSHSFPAMERLAIQRGNAFVLVYSVQDKHSFDDLSLFYNEIVSNKSTLDKVPIIIVGNKCDLLDRQVPEMEGERLAKQWKCLYVEASAKQSKNARELFELLLRNEDRQKLTLDSSKKTKKSKKKSMQKKCVIM